MEMDSTIGQRSVLKLREKGVALTLLEHRCILGARHRGGRVDLGPDRVVWLMLYAMPMDEYERMLRMRSEEVVANGTGGGLLPVGRGALGNVSDS